MCLPKRAGLSRVSAAEAVHRLWSRAMAAASLKRGPVPLLHHPHAVWHLPSVSSLGRFPRGVPQQGRHLKPKVDDLHSIRSQKYHVLYSDSRIHVLRLQYYLRTIIRRGRCYVLRRRDPVTGKSGNNHIHGARFTDGCLRNFPSVTGVPQRPYLTL